MKSNFYIIYKNVKKYLNVKVYIYWNSLMVILKINSLKTYKIVYYLIIKKKHKTCSHLMVTHPHSLNRHYYNPYHAAQKCLYYLHFCVVLVWDVQSDELFPEIHFKISHSEVSSLYCNKILLWKIFLGSLSTTKHSYPLNSLPLANYEFFCVRHCDYSF